MKKQTANVIYFLIWCLVLFTTLLLMTGHIPFMLGILIAGFTIFYCGDERVRKTISYVMVLGLSFITLLIAISPSASKDPSAWLFSKIIFVAFFGIFGSEIVRKIDFSKDYLAKYFTGKWTKDFLVKWSIRGSFFLIFCAYLLKFGSQGKSEEIEIIAKSVCEAAKKCVGIAAEVKAYELKDWAEDVLFGIASVWFAILVPKAVVSAEETKNASGTSNQP